MLTRLRPASTAVRAMAGLWAELWGALRPRPCAAGSAVCSTSRAEAAARRSAGVSAGLLEAPHGVPPVERRDWSCLRGRHSVRKTPVFDQVFAVPAPAGVHLIWV